MKHDQHLRPEKTLAEMMAELKEVLGDDGNVRDFEPPSLLREVPSFTSTDSWPLGDAQNDAELGGRAK